MRLFISKLFNYVLLTSKNLGIDESHGIMHSMNTLQYAKKIYNSELINTPRLIHDKEIIYAASTLHDMCDYKYTDEKSGSSKIKHFLESETNMTNEEITATINIVTTMSYSKVKKVGYPKLGKYQTAYHIVREADLLCSYDFNRALIYDMAKNNSTFNQAYENSHKFFIKRVLQYFNDDLFIHNFSKKEAIELHGNAIKQIENIKNIISDNRRF
uniref:HD domain-containing protein n=1 Tax=viral metagenome TaxID=1070528 RepID=A0A6C0KTP4_9ZZZZ